MFTWHWVVFLVRTWASCLPGYSCVQRTLAMLSQQSPVPAVSETYASIKESCYVKIPCHSGHTCWTCLTCSGFQASFFCIQHHVVLLLHFDYQHEHQQQKLHLQFLCLNDTVAISEKILPHCPSCLWGRDRILTYKKMSINGHLTDKFSHGSEQLIWSQPQETPADRTMWCCLKKKIRWTKQW